MIIFCFYGAFGGPHKPGARGKFPPLPPPPPLGGPGKNSREPELLEYQTN